MNIKSLPIALLFLPSLAVADWSLSIGLMAEVSPDTNLMWQHQNIDVVYASGALFEFEATREFRKGRAVFYRHVSDPNNFMDGPGLNFLGIRKVFKF